MDNLLFLKSGTDIRGTALPDANGRLDLTDDRLRAIAAAFYDTILRTSSSPRIAIGCDSRLSSEHIKTVVSDVLLSRGATVLDCGLSSTPSMFMAVLDLPCDASIEITASHLPPQMNGLKFFTPAGGFSGEDVAALLKGASLLKPFALKPSRTAEKVDYMSVYCEKLCNMIRKGVCAENHEKPLSGLKIAVDAGNGVGAFYAEKVLKVLGADISGSRFLEPDGRFPNHIPNPENETAMASICEAVLSSHADLGVIFDTDCDRAACVDEKGEEINRNRLVALASYIALKGQKDGVIVTDSVTSDGLAEYIEKTLGGVHHRFKRGYKNVIDEAIRLTGEGKFVPLAIETSGHAAFKENYYLDDGAYLVTRIIVEKALLSREGKTLEDVLRPLKEPAEATEVRMTIKLSDFKSYGLQVIEKFTALCESKDGISPAAENYEGIRVNFDSSCGNGWLLLRMSLHEPLLVLNCESAEKGGVQKMLAFFKEFIGQFDQLDLSKLTV